MSTLTLPSYPLDTLDTLPFSNVRTFPASSSFAWSSCAEEYPLSLTPLPFTTSWPTTVSGSNILFTSGILAGTILASSIVKNMPPLVTLPVTFVISAPSSRQAAHFLSASSLTFAETMKRDAKKPFDLSARNDMSTLTLPSYPLDTLDTLPFSNVRTFPASLSLIPSS